MDIVSFDAGAGHKVDRFGGDVTVSPLMKPTDRARTVCMHVAPGGLIGEHEAKSLELFCVVIGSGWVSGDDGERYAINALRGSVLVVWGTPRRRDGHRHGRDGH
jgi:hypothetical protein